MNEYIKITVRTGDEAEFDLSVHQRQPWTHVLDVLTEKKMLPEKQGYTLYSCREKKCFPAEQTSEEAGIYTGDIIMLENKPQA